MDNSERGKFRRRRLLLYLWEWWAWVWLWCKGGECGIIVAMWMVRRLKELWSLERKIEKKFRLKEESKDWM